MKYVEPKKQGHNKGRNPDYPATTIQPHAPFKRAATTVQKQFKDKSLGTTLGWASLGEPKRVRELRKQYKQELERKDGDDKI